MTQPVASSRPTPVDRTTLYDWASFPDLEALLDVELRRDDFRPIWVTDVELTDGLASLAQRVPAGREHQLALVLVRLHAQPLGLVVLDLGADDPRRSWPGRVDGTVGSALAAHRAADGHTTPDSVVPPMQLWEGWSEPTPRCLHARRATLAAAIPTTIVIATRERPEALARCLASLERLEYPSFDVIVVDNAAETDRTREVTDRFRRAGLPVRQVSEPRPGLAHAHNRALREDCGVVVAFTDDDVIVDPHWLSELVSPFVAADRVSCSTGLILPAELDTRAQAFLEAHGRYLKGFDPRRFDLADHRPSDPLFPFTAGAFGAGANMAFDTAFLRGVGGFDAALGTGTIARGGDDLAAFFRVITAGRELAYQPASIVWHHHRRDIASVDRQVYDYAVGFSAYLTSALVHRPRAAVTLLRRLRTAQALARDREASRRTTTTPRLRRLARRGMVVGPAAYAASAVSNRWPRRPVPDASGRAVR